MEAPVRPRVVATDLDGTLLRSDGTLSSRTRAAISWLEETGTSVVFVTARPPRWLDDLADAVGGHGTAICLNGACLYDVAGRRPLSFTGFRPSLLAALVDELRVAAPGIAFGLERASGAVFDPHYTTTEFVIPAHTPRQAVGDVLEESVGKLIARADGVPHDDFLARVSATVGDRAHLAYSGAVGLAEMTPVGVTKAAALARWCEGHGVQASEVWAFGDMPNDLPMLRWAGTSIAVANAHPDVLAEASLTTASNDDDGVARALDVLRHPLDPPAPGAVDGAGMRQ
ncbi:HAD-IIB family hydrolase [Sanguibacter sp. 25GB23B1]|uniref:HAD family hydrolase n=1 Tax=unclassified Sanguibacter TaxID=2645534 RepID=UPI0032AF48E7